MNTFSAVVSAVTLLLIVVLAFAQGKNKAICLEHGYPNQTINWKLEGYCVKRINQTDTVVAIKELRR